MSFPTSIYIIQGSWGKSYACTWDYQSDDTIFLRPSPVSRVTTGSADESGGPVQLLRPDESWLVGGMVERLHSSTQLHQAGPAFPHSPHFSNTTRLLQPRPTWLAPAPGSRRPFKALEVLSVYATLCPPPPTRNWFDLKCSAESVEKKNRRWKDARIHPHSHTTPILTRHQLDNFQEFWHVVSLFFTYGTLLRKSEVDQL